MEQEHCDEDAGGQRNLFCDETVGFVFDGIQFAFHSSRDSRQVRVMGNMKRFSVDDRNAIEEFRDKKWVPAAKNRPRWLKASPAANG